MRRLDINASHSGKVVRPNVIVRVAALALFALVPWSVHSGSAASSRAQSSAADDTPSACNDQDQSDPLDEPSVQTDPARPITEDAADEGDNDGETDDGMCRSQTLELWFPQKPSFLVQALNDTDRATS